MYTPTKVNVFVNQRDKLKNAIAHHKATSIKLDIQGVGVDGGAHTLLLTREQIARIERSRIVGTIQFKKVLD